MECKTINAVTQFIPNCFQTRNNNRGTVFYFSRSFSDTLCHNFAQEVNHWYVFIRIRNVCFRWGRTLTWSTLLSVPHILHSDNGWMCFSVTGFTSFRCQGQKPRSLIWGKDLSLLNPEWCHSEAISVELLRWIHILCHSSYVCVILYGSTSII